MRSSCCVLLQVATFKAPSQAAAARQSSILDTVDVIKQHPGLQQCERAVKVNVPGKHFPALTQSEQAKHYEGTAMQYEARHKFPRHLKAWGQPHTGPGIRFTCMSDALDDPDNRGYWTTLALWNKWRHHTYKDNPEAELQFLDELPVARQAGPAAPDANADVKDAAKEEPEVKKYFTITHVGTHVIKGSGRNKHKEKPCTYFACNVKGCKRGPNNPIKQVGRDTGGLFHHLSTCRPDLCRRLRTASKHSAKHVTEDGEEYELYSFNELLPHHARYVQKCFRGFDHFNETRADNGLKEYVQGYNRQASLPHAKTCHKLLDVHEELVAEKMQKIIEAHIAMLGVPCAGSTGDIWSLQSCRESFYCLRLSIVVDGDLLSGITGDPQYKGKLIDFAPIAAFQRFTKSRHTGAVLARWKEDTLRGKGLQNAIGLATEDGASNNKSANRLAGQEMMVCVPHDIARAVLYACGQTGKPNKNPELAQFLSRSGKQSASFSRSVVANQDLRQAQLDANADLKEHECLTTKTKNKTRWLGLWSMCNRNRRIGPEIRIALTGQEDGVCNEAPARPVQPPVAPLVDSSSDGSDGDESDGDDQEEGNRKGNKTFPLAHRCLSMEDFRLNDIAESLLDRPRELTLVVQDEEDGYGEGLDLGMTYLYLTAIRNEMRADRVEIVSGRDKTEVWKVTAPPRRRLPPLPPHLIILLRVLHCTPRRLMPPNCHQCSRHSARSWHSN